MTASAVVADVVHLRDGTSISGRLTVCDEETCVIDRQRIARGRIARLTLGDGATVPPGTAPGAILKDGSVRPGPLTDLNSGFIAIGETEIDRDEVAEVLLVATPAAAAQQPSRPIVPPSDAAPPSPGSPSAPTPPANPSAASAQPVPAAPPLVPRYGAADEPIRKGGLWIGKIIGRRTYRDANGSESMDIEVDGRFREYIRTILSDPPNVKKVAEFVFLNDEGTVVRNDYRSSDGWQSCSGSGESAPVHHPPGTWSSTIYRRLAVGPMPALAPFDIPAGEGFYTLMTIPAVDGLDTYRRTCVDSDGVRTADVALELVGVGRLPVSTVLIDPEIRYVERGRMSGMYDTSPRPGERVMVSWSVCREGIQCPPPAPLDPDAPAGGSTDTTEPVDPCSSGPQAALADTCRAQLDAAVALLEPLFAEYNALMAAVQADRAAFETMQKWCLAYDTVQQILESIITGGTGAAAESAQALLHLRNLIGKIQSGSIVNDFLPKEVKKVLDIYKKTEGIWTELTMDDVTRMQRDVSACSGKAPLETYMGAKRFVDNVAASRGLWESRVAPAINDVRSKTQECAGKNHAAWRACAEAARCRNETPNCGPEP